ncbi:MAG: hypothetical protein ACI311_04535 [Bacilli bacterium]
MSFKEKLQNTNEKIKNKALNTAENVVGSYEENPFEIARNSFYKLKTFINVILTLALFALSSINILYKISANGITPSTIVLLSANALYIVIIIIYLFIYRQQIKDNNNTYKSQLSIMYTKLGMKVLKVTVAIFLFFNLNAGHNIINTLTIIFSFFAILNGLIGLIRNIFKICKFHKNKDKYLSKKEKRKEIYTKVTNFYDESRIKKTSAIETNYIENKEEK